MSSARVFLLPACGHKGLAVNISVETLAVSSNMLVFWGVPVQPYTAHEEEVSGEM